MLKENSLYVFAFICPFLLIFGFIAGREYLRQNIWTGFYYPNKENVGDYRNWIVSPPLYSLNECRAWVNAIHKIGDNYDYQCGLGCRFTTKYGEISMCRADAK